jgi:carbon-monoxide dehydrogenase large subunit
MAAQLVAAELGCPLEAVTTTFGDTDEVPQGIGTFNSRTVASAGSMVFLAARAVRELALSAAAVMTDGDVGDLELTSRGVGDGTGGWLTLAEIASWLRRRGANEAPDLPRELAASETYGTEQAIGTVANGAHLAVVAVDPHLATVSIERYVAVEDCGRILNPIVVEGQIQGGIAQGIGGALLEEFVYDDDGQPLTVNLADYVIPGAADVPDVETYHVVTPSPLTPHGAKGMAEGATIPVAAVLAAAIDDALAPLGTPPIDTVPFTPQRLHEHIVAAAPVPSDQGS